MSTRNLPPILAKRLKPLARLFEAKRSAVADEALQLSLNMQKIHAEQARIKSLLDDSARDGVVPDAHVLSLHACNLAELAETRRQLGEEEAAYQASLMRLDAMFPPLPEPPAPKPAQRFPLVGDLLSERGQPNPLH